jgi:hypothetical protein
MLLSQYAITILVLMKGGIWKRMELYKYDVTGVQLLPPKSEVWGSMRLSIVVLTSFMVLLMYRY